MDVTAVSDALAAAAASVVVIPRLNTFGYVPDSVPEPCGFVADVDIDFDKTMGRGLDEMTVTFRVLVSMRDDKSASLYIADLLKGSGPTSLKAAFQAANGAPGQAALGGAADFLHVMRARAMRLYEHAGATYLGVEIEIRVIGSGS